MKGPSEKLCGRGAKKLRADLDYTAKFLHKVCTSLEGERVR